MKLYIATLLGLALSPPFPPLPGCKSPPRNRACTPPPPPAPSPIRPPELRGELRPPGRICPRRSRPVLQTFRPQGPRGWPWLPALVRPVRPCLEPVRLAQLYPAPPMQGPSPPSHRGQLRPAPWPMGPWP
ncbi:hypothetical protein BDA96_08G076000 [Sorghum bicolor]|uniref:Uncharacterized protein n=1 Tax=Sorghum bicolor TaxID=4558 RepID=A0A921QGE0_SORBI|nr:hypothetical protein BDA96_08G076000 [Sorghum bicolor]